jgi:hypothetical protein
MLNLTVMLQTVHLYEQINYPDVKRFSHSYTGLVKIAAAFGIIYVHLFCYFVTKHFFIFRLDWTVHERNLFALLFSACVLLLF